MIIGVLLFLFVVAFQMLYMVITMIFTNSSRHRSVNSYLDEMKMSILIPAYNEENVLQGCLSGLTSLNYSNYEVIFINDGSSDHTLDVLTSLLDLTPSYNILPKSELHYTPVTAFYRSQKYPNMIVIDKINGGKADSLNAGADIATGEVVITLDADSILESNALLHINESFHNHRVIAAGGMVHVGQMFDSKGNPSFKGNFLLKYQLSEYLTSFYIRKFTQSKLRVMSIVSGAFGAFRTNVLLEIGGYKKTLGEDMEITLNIQKYINSSNNEYKMVFIPKAECYTEIPENIRDLFKQKTRWQKGFIDCLVKYRSSVFKSLGTRFTLFLLWDSLGMAALGLTTLVTLPLIIAYGELSTYYVYCLAISLSIQFFTKIIAYWANNKYCHVFSVLDYIKIAIFFMLEIPIKPIFDAVLFSYGTVSYFTSRDKQDWNKVKRLGNVSVIQNYKEIDRGSTVTNDLQVS